MTGTRVLTALVLMPLAIVIVLFGSTAVVAVAVAVLTILALWEYFALGDAIGHRAYRLWIVTCALLLIFLQWKEAYGVGTSSSAFPCRDVRPIDLRAGRCRPDVVQPPSPGRVAAGRWNFIQRPAAGGGPIVFCGAFA